MTSKTRYLPWWPRDFPADEHVIRMTLEEEGAYRRLLDHEWMHGSIPADLRTLASICKNLPVARMRRVWVKLAPCFQVVAGQPDRLINGKLERVREEQDLYIAQKAAAGKRGAEKRWDSAMAVPSSRHPSANGTPMTEAWPPTPTPTPTLKRTAVLSHEQRDGSRGRGPARVQKLDEVGLGDLVEHLRLANAENADRVTQATLRRVEEGA